jgi:putative DNA-invertase from lambdoid prophage Rac
LALGGVDLTSAAGKMTMQVLNAVAEFERDLLIERTNSGIQRAKAEGKHLGRKHSLSADERQQIQRRLAQGETVSALAREYQTTRQTIIRARNSLVVAAA